jgi:pyruvate,water dikinase
MASRSWNWAPSGARMGALGVLAVGLAALGACGGDNAPASSNEPKEGACIAMDGVAAPDFLSSIGCRKDYDLLASLPLDTSIPGAVSVKVVLDQRSNDTLYFQNSKKYDIHYKFASANLSGQGKPVVGTLSDFNTTEYFKPDRRFILGAVTYYEQPKVWALEIAPYDTASPAMIAKLYDAVVAKGYFGSALAFHPTSQTIEASIPMLASRIKVKTSNELFAAIDYQPLNLATALGRLHFLKATEVDTSYLSYRDIVVLDNVPNDISVVSGIITEEFQTPLSHVNVLSQNRKTPNMGLRHATTDSRLRTLEGKWVKLVVGATEWSISEVTSAEADAYWTAHKPVAPALPPVDLAVTDLRNVQDVVKEADFKSLREAIKAAVGAFGGKAVHYSVMVNTPEIPILKGFVIPAAHYVKFMKDNGFFTQIDAMLADPEFKDKPEVRDAKLKALRQAIMAAPIDQALQTAIQAKLAAEYPKTSMRYRTSTNSEDLEGFPCAGCYESHTGNADDWPDHLNAIKKSWASIWLFRTFEERDYNSVDHKSVVMALLVHHNFPSEEANGVALTANPFDSSGSQPGFYVNVQFGGDAEVVHPPAGVTSDQFIYQFDQPGQPVSYLSHSSLIAAGSTVLTPAQVNQLGLALDAIHKRFSPAYGPQAGNNGWYAMDVEFKFDGDPGQVPTLFVKQARPHPGRGQ